MCAVADIWSEGRSGAAAQFNAQAEVMYDFFRQEADKVRIAGDAGVVIREDALRSRCATDVIVFFQQQYTQARASEIRGRDQSVMTCAEDDDVVLGFQFHEGLDVGVAISAVAMSLLRFKEDNLLNFRP